MPLKHSVHEVSLKNGAKGIIVDVPGTTAVSYQFHFRAGNEYVADKKREQTAHIMEHLAFGQMQSTEALLSLVKILVKTELTLTLLLVAEAWCM